MAGSVRLCLKELRRYFWLRFPSFLPYVYPHFPGKESSAPRGFHFYKQPGVHIKRNSLQRGSLDGVLNANPLKIGLDSLKEAYGWNGENIGKVVCHFTNWQPSNFQAKGWLCCFTHCWMHGQYEWIHVVWVLRHSPTHGILTIQFSWRFGCEWVTHSWHYSPIEYGLWVGTVMRAANEYQIRFSIFHMCTFNVPFFIQLVTRVHINATFNALPSMMLICCLYQSSNHIT